MKTYKVWIHIEECDEDNDYYEDVTEPFCPAEFDTLAKAETYCDDLMIGGD